MARGRGLVFSYLLSADLHLQAVCGEEAEDVQYINERKWHVLSFLWRISSKPATRSLRHLVCLFHLSFPRSLSLFSHSFALMLHFSSVFFSFLVVYLKLFLRKIKTHYEGLKMLKANKIWRPTNPFTSECFDVVSLSRKPPKLQPYSLKSRNVPMRTLFLSEIVSVKNQQPFDSWTHFDYGADYWLIDLFSCTIHCFDLNRLLK